MLYEPSNSSDLQSTKYGWTFTSRMVYFARMQQFTENIFHGVLLPFHNYPPPGKGELQWLDLGRAWSHKDLPYESHKYIDCYNML